MYRGELAGISIMEHQTKHKQHDSTQMIVADFGTEIQAATREGLAGIGAQLLDLWPHASCDIAVES